MVALCLGLTGCYLPSLSHTRGVGTIRALQAEGETDASLRQKLGRPDVLDLPTVRVWEWRQTYGYLLVGGAGRGAILPLQGKAFRVLARFQGDRVTAIETQVEPERVKGLGDPLPEPMLSIPWEGPGRLGTDRFFAVGKDGSLWRRERAADQAVQVVPGEGKGGQNALIAMSPDGCRVAMAGPRKAYVWDEPSQSVVIEAVPKKGPWRYPPYGGEARFSPDGRWLALVGSRDSLLLDMVTLQPVWADHKGSWFSACFSPAGDRLVLIGYRELMVIETATGRVTGRMILSSAPHWSGLLRAGGELLLVCGTVLSRWDLAEVERLYRDGQRPVRLLGDMGSEALREVSLLPMLATGYDPIPPPLISPDGTWLLMRGPNQASFGVLRTSDGQEAGLFRKDAKVLAVSPVQIDDDGSLYGTQSELPPHAFRITSVHHLWMLPLRVVAVP